MNPCSFEEKSEKVLKILIVDDDRIICHLHQNQIKKNRLNCETVFLHDGEKAMKYLEKKDRFNNDFLILLDLNMPVMNGWEFLEKLKERDFRNKIFIVIITSSTIKADLFKAMAYDRVINFFEKPLSFENVKEIVEADLIKTYFRKP